MSNQVFSVRQCVPNNPYLFRDTLLKLIQSGKLPYQELTENKL